MRALVADEDVVGDARPPLHDGRRRRDHGLRRNLDEVGQKLGDSWDVDTRLTFPGKKNVTGLTGVDLTRALGKTTPEGFVYVQLDGKPVGNGKPGPVWEKAAKLYSAGKYDF